MNKIFLYLYPIKEFANVFFLGNEYYDANNFKRPFDVLNEAIEKRYRDKGYRRHAPLWEFRQCNARFAYKRRARAQYLSQSFKRGVRGTRLWGAVFLPAQALVSALFAHRH